MNSFDVFDIKGFTVYFLQEELNSSWTEEDIKEEPFDDVCLFSSKGTEHFSQTNTYLCNLMSKNFDI